LFHDDAMSCPNRKSAAAGRKDERVLVDLPVRFADGGDGVMRNVSASGVYFQTARALEAGETVDLEMTFLDARGAAIEVRCCARVVWVEKKGAVRGIAGSIVSLEFRRPRSAKV
jgi:hypothetical protein